MSEQCIANVPQIIISTPRHVAVAKQTLIKQLLVSVISCTSSAFLEVTSDCLEKKCDISVRKLMFECHPVIFVLLSVPVLRTAR